MPTLPQMRLHPIRDEDLFEDLCRDLWSLIWADPSTQRNGRRGQAQRGVDVFGRPYGTGPYEGIQAKACDQALSEAQIQSEVDAARGFTPPLRRLIIATTAPRDVKGQEYARRVTLEHAKHNLFSVSLLGWVDIVGLAQDHLVAERPDLAEKYFEVTVTSSAVAKAVIERCLPAVRIDANTAAASQQFHPHELDLARQLIKTAKPKSAIAYLDHCHDVLGSHDQPYVRYRFLHYYACANYVLGNREEAGRDFAKALQHNPDDETALAFAALGFHLLGDRANAVNCARRALLKNPASTQAYGVLVQAESASRGLPELVEIVPEPYRSHSEVAHSLAIAAHEKGCLEEAERWARLAVEKRAGRWPDLNGFLGEIILQRAIGAQGKPVRTRIGGERRGRLETAITELTTAWDEVKDTELASGRVHWLSNRALAGRLLGDTARACEDLDEAIRLSPDNPDLLEQLALVAYDDGDLARAAQLLHRLSREGHHAQCDLLYAAVLQDSRQYPEAEHVLARLLEVPIDAFVRMEARWLSLQGALAQRDWEAMQDICSTMQAESPNSPLVGVARASYLRAQGDSGGALAVLRDTRPLITPETPERHLVLIASEWLALKEYAEAAALYERVVEQDDQSHITRALLECYYQSGDLARTLTLGQRLLQLHGPLPFVSEVVGSVLEEVGDLPRASEVIGDYLKTFPNDAAAHLHHATLSMRLGDSTAVDLYITRATDTSQWPLHQMLGLAYLYVYRGRIIEALSIGYEARRKFGFKSEAHLCYVSLFFDVERAECGDVLQPGTVAVDTAVQVRDEEAREEWYIIEERLDSKAPNELPLDHPLAQRLLNRQIGSRVLLKESPYHTDTGTVVGLQSKYVYALQESMRNFEKLFPDTPGLWNIPIRSRSVGQEAVDEFKSLFDMISKRHDHYVWSERLYRDGKITLGVLAQITGGSVLGTWASLTQNTGPGLRCCTGDNAEFKTAQEAVRPQGVLVADVISLYSFYTLECKDALLTYCGRLRIAQSTRDLLSRLLDEQRRRRADGFMTVGKEGDHFVRQVFTAEEIQASTECLQNFVTWVSNNCDVLPVLGALERGREYREHLNDLMDPSFVDTLLIASGGNHVLYSDDERLRSLARNELGCTGVWTQAILAKAAGVRAISREAYASEVVRLVCANYHHTHVDARAILVAAQQANWRPGYPFAKVIGVLSGATSAEESALRVATEAIFDIWRERLLDHQRVFLLQSILEQLVRGRQATQVLPKLSELVSKRFRLLPIQQGEVLTLIQCCAQARGLVGRVIWGER